MKARATEASELPRDSEMKSSRRTSRTRHGDESSRATTHRGEETSMVVTRRGDETLKSTRHGSADESARPSVMPISTRAPENYVATMKSARDPRMAASTNDTTSFASKRGSKHTTYLQVPTSALTATSSHSRRRDTSSASKADSTMPETTALSRPRFERRDTIIVQDDTDLTVIPKTKRETETKVMNKTTSKDSKNGGLDLELPKCDNVVVNIYQGNVVQNTKKDGK